MPAQFALNPQILKSVPLFSSFSDAHLSQVLAAVQHRSYPRGAFILRAGEETDDPGGASFLGRSLSSGVHASRCMSFVGGS